MNRKNIISLPSACYLGFDVDGTLIKCKYEPLILACYKALCQVLID